MADAGQRKREAAAAAVALVEDGMRLGLGTGSTVAHFLDLLGERMAAGDVKGIVGVPTSLRTETRATELGIPLAGLQELQPLDLTVDGADEIDPALDLIKGLGGALLREKMVAEASRSLVIIADDSKTVPRLGTRAPLPVEVLAFAWESHLPFLVGLGANAVLRTVESGEPIVTDNGNYILDCHFEAGIPDPSEVEAALVRRAGVVGTGLFLGLADRAFIASVDGVVERGRIQRSSPDGRNEELMTRSDREDEVGRFEPEGEASSSGQGSEVARP